MGSRLGPHTLDTPKTLLTLGSQTIFDRIVVGLSKIGIKDVIVVVGHAGVRLRSHALAYSRAIVKNEMNFEFIHNDNLNAGNIYSFWLARRKMEDDFVLLNSDVVFDYEALNLLKNYQKRTALLIDDTKPLGYEEMKVKVTKTNIIRDISKNLNPSTSRGEYIGIMKVSSKDAPRILHKAQYLLSKKNFPLYYEDAFRLVAQEEDCLFACSTNRLPWTEIDTIDDMNFAKSIIMPKIESLV
jgi:2-aminoethylphosphonate-pyruvate transaminase